MYNLVDFENQFSKQKINKAKKLVVRELEEDKNKFIGFVDENEESYDVEVGINAKLGISDYTCDCGEKGFCNHLLAMAIGIAELKTNKKPRKTRAKKVPETELAMENLNSEELKNWLLEFFKKNKEAEIQFLLEFGEKKTEFSGEEIKSIIARSIQSVVGKKMTITAPEMKKLVDILNKSLEPVEEFMWLNIDKDISLEVYNLISHQLHNFIMKIYTTSNRIEGFLDKLRVKFAINTNKIKDGVAWEKLAQKYWNLYLKGDGNIDSHIYYLLLDIYKNGDHNQKKFISKIVQEGVVVWMNNKVHLRTELREHLLDILIENEMFAAVKSYFPIAYYQNSYNLKVLQQWLATDQQKVEQWCNEIISRNSNPKYNSDYYEILEDIYIENADFSKLAMIKKLKFQGNPKLEDYIFIEKHESDKGEFKKWRTKVLANLRRSFYDYPDNALVYFQILEHEKNYAKMIDVIDDNLPTSVINLYVEKLYLLDKNKLLSKINIRTPWSSIESEDEKLADFLISKYDSAHLKEIFGRMSISIFRPSLGRKILEKLSQKK